MDYRKAWDEVKAKLEESLEEGRDIGANDETDTRESGMYEAYERTLAHMKELESGIPGVIKVGDTVRVVDGDRVYQLYSAWIRANVGNPFLSARWAHCRRIREDAIGVVKVIAPHGEEDRDLAYIQVGNACYIIGLDGLELIAEG